MQGRRARRPRARWVLGVLAALLAAGCAPAGPIEGPECASRRLNVARSFYEEAQDELARYFRQREDHALTRAYHASEDATTLARAARGCPDFDELTRRRAIDLIKTSILLQKLVVSNMRDQDPGVVVDLYGSQYREIFRTDIH